MLPNSSLNPVYLIGLVAVAVCLAGAILVWWRKVRSQRKPAAQESTPGGAGTAQANASASKTIDDLFHEANNRLKLAPKMKGASVANLPAFLIVGPPGSGKTSVMLHSGLEPELLAGQVYQGAKVAPTETLNIWLARQVIFIEIPTPFATDANSLKRIIKHLKPGGIGQALRRDHAPRGLLLCTNQAQVAEAATPGEISALARPWNQCLSLIAAGLGIQLPVYVLFSKLDAMAGFAEFVSNLSARESAQAVGAATRPFNAATDGAYAEETARVFNQHFCNLAFGLCDSRLPVLKREQDRTHLAVGYQFPREFQKLQKNLVQFLVEVGRPSQLQVSPFLRGMYFCGTRKVAVDGPRKQAAAEAAQPDRTGMLDATTVLSREQIQMQLAAAQSAESPQSSHEITEWMFLPAVFESVLLGDRKAHGVSATSSGTNRVRTMAFGVLAILGLFVAAALTISYGLNRRLEKDLVSAAKSLADTTSTESPARRLEQMSKPLQSLVDIRSHTPLSMAWGLYPGKDLLGPAQAIYCSAVKSMVLKPVVSKMTNDLASLGTAGTDSTTGLVGLKAYMMMTTHPQYADEKFLAEQLFGTWLKTPAAEGAAESRQLLPEEFRLYGSLLSVPDEQGSCTVTAPRDLIPTAQQYLRSHYDKYQSLLESAGRGIAGVNYDNKYPNAAVHDNFTVPGWFTVQGWKQMQDALDGHGESPKTDAWVLGGGSAVTQEDPSAKAGEYRSRYITEYQQAWKRYLDSASIAPYANLKDAVAKLDAMSNRHSQLLRLIGLAAEHTGSIEAMKAAFQPASAVARSTEDFEPAKEYLSSLDRLKTKLARAAEPGLAHDQDLSDARIAANEAEDTVTKLAELFKGDTDQAVKHLLLEPIKSVPQLLVKQNADALNGAGKNLCAAYPDAFPFKASAGRRATPDQIHRLFDRSGGEMWQLYDQSLKDSIICGGVECSEKPSPKFMVHPRFLAFFNGLYHWDHLLESGGQLGRISLSLRALKFNQLKSLNLTIDDQHFVLQAGGEARIINWDVNRSQKLSLEGEFEAGAAHELFLPESPGPWALFDWLFDSVASGGGGEFYWVPKSGTITRQHFANNQTKEYKIEIRLAGGPALDRRSLNIGTCPQQMAK